MILIKKHHDEDMYHLFNKILALPTLSFENNPKKTDYLSEVISSGMTSKDIENYSNAKQNKKQKILSKYEIKEFESYFLAYTAAEKAIQLWHQKINGVKDPNAGHVFAADDLVPMTSVLLPNDDNLLKEMQHNLDVLLRMIQKGETAYMFTNLYSAVTSKLNRVLPRDDHVEYSSIKNDIELIDLESAKNTCEEYRNLLLMLFIDKLKKNDDTASRLAYLYYFKRYNCISTQHTENIISELKEDFDNEMLNLPEDEEATLYIHKIFSLSNLLKTLSQSTSTSERLYKYYTQLRCESGLFVKNHVKAEKEYLVKLDAFDNAKIKIKQSGSLSKVSSTFFNLAKNKVTGVRNPQKLDEMKEDEQDRLRFLG